jgi:oligosaccharide repeat unit polymerase
MKLYNIAITHFLLLLYIVISTIFIAHLPKYENLVFYSQLLLFITFIWTLYAQILLNGMIHIFTIFLGLFFLFLLSLPFFDLINIIDIHKKYLFTYIKLSNEIYLTVYTYSTLFIAIIFQGIIFGYVNEGNIKKSDIKFSSYLYSAGILIFIFALPGILTKYYLQLHVIFQQGYLAIYNGSLQGIKYPLICTGSGTLLLIGYSIFISSKPNKKQFLIISIIFLITQLINGLKGQRAVLMFPFVFVVWFYLKFYVGNISKKKIIIIVLCVAVVGQSINFLRSNRHFTTKNESFAEKYISSFFVQQGVSFFIFPYMLHYDLKNDRYPYLLAPLDIRSYGELQTLDRLQRFNYLPDHLMYRMLPKDFKKGSGIGSSLLAIFYDLPNAVAILLCFLMGFFIAKFDVYIKKSRLLLASSYYIVFAVVSSPRYEPLQLFYDLVMVWIVYLLIEGLHLNASIANTNIVKKNE